MSVYAGPNVVENGLVLALDAANPKSYPGTGTAWFDISGLGNNGTLVNGVGYNSGNGGSLTFDGVDDYASGDLLSGSNTSFTISSWIRTGSISSNQIFLSIGTEAVTGKAVHLRFLSSPTSFRFSLYGSNLDVTLPTNASVNFTNVVCVLDSNQLQAVYQNGNFVSSRTPIVSVTANNRFNLGRWGLEAPEFGYPGEYWTGNISNVQIYNRALSAAEVAQNFNAFRGRFGI
jgi:hypothetical protein